MFFISNELDANCSFFSFEIAMVSVAFGLAFLKLATPISTWDICDWSGVVVWVMVLASFRLMPF